jgi:hypothetical protein
MKIANHGYPTVIDWLNKGLQVQYCTIGHRRPIGFYSQIKLSRPVWCRPETRTSLPDFLNPPNRFYAIRFP